MHIYKYKSGAHHSSVGLAGYGGVEAFNSGEDALTSGCKVQVSSWNIIIISIIDYGDNDGQGDDDCR